MKSLFLLSLLSQLPSLIHSQNTTTPPGCRALNTDTDWPAPSIWAAALPGIIPSNTTSDANGPLPDYRYRVTSHSEVQAAVNFCREHNIRITVITTGHDQEGRSDAGSGLIIDLSKLRGVRVLESFEPTMEGAQSPKIGEEPNVIVPKEGVQAAVTFGPAVAGLALNYAVWNSSLWTISGAAATVAVSGGWGQNGGYGPLTAQYGLGVDQWLEAKIVTPDGQLRIANAVSNPDLYWAIRGGGGGTFGIVVESTWKAYPSIPIIGYNWYINSTDTTGTTDPLTGESPVSAAMEYLFAQMPALHEMGISAYFYVSSPTAIRCYAVHPGNNSGIANANAVWGPILSHISNLPNMTAFQTKPYDFVDYKDYFDTTYGALEEPFAAELPVPRNRGIIPYDSRLLAAAHITSPDITHALRTTGGAYGILMCAPGMKVGDGSDTSANPGWRKAVVLMVGQKTAQVSMDGLRELAPDMGTYINEASVLEPNWTTSFWGTNYPRLSSIKSSLDPNMTLWVSPGINADHMESVNGRACLVSPLVGVGDEPSFMPPPTDRHVAANMTTDGLFLFGKQELIGTRYPEPGTWEGLQTVSG